MKSKVFLCEFIHPAARASLCEFADLVDSWDRIEEVDAIFSRNLQITNDILDRAKRLRVIGIHGTGIDGVDLKETQQRGIRVFSVPHQNSQSVAELNVGLILSLSRKIALAQRLLGEGKVNENAPASLKGFEIQGKTAGFIGVGDIARKTAKILTGGFSMRAVGYSRSFTMEEGEGVGIGCLPSKEAVLQEADILLIGVPLTPQTRGMIGEAEFRLMKPSSLVINTARGAVIDEAALLRALQEGWIAGAGCDVFCEEPPKVSNPLLSLPNFVATPHIGSNTEEALYRIGMAVSDGIRKALLDA